MADSIYSSAQDLDEQQVASEAAAAAESEETQNSSLNDVQKEVLASAVTSSVGMSNMYLSSTRLYVCGVLMPVTSVEIVSAVDSYPTAVFTLPPDSRLLELGRGDKIPVHIFQKETYVESPNYVLVFYGYIVSRAYQNTATGRSIRFQAMSYYSLLNEVRIDFLSTLSGYARGIIPGEKEKSVYVSINGNADPLYMLMLKGLGVNDKSQDCIEFPYQYLQNILLFITSLWLGSMQTDTDSSLTKNNSRLAQIYGRYFTYYTAGNNAYPILPYFDTYNDTKSYNIWEKDSSEKAKVFPLLKGTQTATMAYMLGTQKHAGLEAGTLRGLLDIIAGNFEYELACFNSPSFYQGNKDDDLAYNHADHLNDLCFKPILYDSIPPLCNVVFRSQVLSINQEEVFNTQATRVQLKDNNSASWMLAQQASGGTTNLLTTRSHTFGYPSSDIKEENMQDALECLANKTEVNSEDISSLFAQTVLLQEYYSGVRTFECTTPIWWKWLPDAEDTETNTRINTIAQRLAQRMLMNAAFQQRVISVTTTYNPYITPGFPGVVFDASNTGLAFAGYIVSVSHSIGKYSMQTSFTMNYVRTLQYAALFDIRHPVVEVEDVLHTDECMTDVYNAVLGHPVDKKHKQVNGSVAMAFSTIYEQFTSDTNSTTSPQNDPFRAYAIQRRNIVTFDDFLTFMNMKVSEYGTGPDGAATPIVLATIIKDENKDNPARHIFKDRMPIYVPVSVSTEDAATTKSKDENSTNAESDTSSFILVTIDDLIAIVSKDGEALKELIESYDSITSTERSEVLRSVMEDNSTNKKILEQLKDKYKYKWDELSNASAAWFTTDSAVSTQAAFSKALQEAKSSASAVDDKKSAYDALLSDNAASASEVNTAVSEIESAVIKMCDCYVNLQKARNALTESRIEYVKSFLEKSSSEAKEDRIKRYNQITTTNTVTDNSVDTSSEQLSIKVETTTNSDGKKIVTAQSEKTILEGVEKVNSLSSKSTTKTTFKAVLPAELLRAVAKEEFAKVIYA